MARALDGGIALTRSAMQAYDTDTTDSSGVYRSSDVRALWSSRTRVQQAIDPEVLWTTGTATTTYDRDLITIAPTAAGQSRTLRARSSIPLSLAGRTDFSMEARIPDPENGNYGGYTCYMGITAIESDASFAVAYLQWAVAANGDVTRSIGVNVGADSFVVQQASWSIDAFDGTGPSRATFDPRRATSGAALTYEVPVQMMITHERNANRIRFAFWWRRQWVYVHEVTYTTVVTYAAARWSHARPYITFTADGAFAMPGGTAPALRVLYMLATTTAPPDMVTRRVRAFTGAPINSGASGTHALQLAVRFQYSVSSSAIYCWGAFAQPISVTFYNAGATMVTWRAMRGGTSAGSTWVASAADYMSMVETNVTELPTGGYQVAGGFIPVGATVTVSLAHLQRLEETGNGGATPNDRDLLTFTATTASATPCSVSTSFTWAEAAN